MDRCHRIGQLRPVLVFRLATAHSVEGAMLRRANSKMALERLVIKKGAFLPDTGAGGDAKSTAGLSPEELADLLKNDTSLEDLPQSAALSDKDMAKLLNRKHMETGGKAPYADVGPGWEVVSQLDGSGLLAAALK
jgi:ATP-dependent DNA helicase